MELGLAICDALSGLRGAEMCQAYMGDLPQAGGKQGPSNQESEQEGSDDYDELIHGELTKEEDSFGS